MTTVPIGVLTRTIRPGSVSWIPFGSLSTAFAQPVALSSHVIHPKSKRLEEHHVFELTGSFREPLHPPPRFLSFTDTFNVYPWKRLIEKAMVFESIFETSSFDTAQLASNKNLSTVQNLLKIVFSQSLDYDILRNLHVTGEFKVRSSWHCKGKRLDVRGRPPGLLIKSRDPLEPFFTKSDLDSMRTNDDRIDTEEMSLNNASLDSKELFSNLTAQNIHNDESLTLIKAHHRYPYCHTMIRLHNYDSIDSSVVYNTVLYLHGLAEQQALARGKVDSAELTVNPECVQCLITNGKEFLFIWYQLNTLLGNGVTFDDSNRNVVMFSEPEKLFTSVIQTTRRTDYSSRRLLDYNEDVLRKFVSFFLWQ